MALDETCGTSKNRKIARAMGGGNPTDSDEEVRSMGEGGENAQIRTKIRKRKSGTQRATKLKA